MLTDPITIERLLTAGILASLGVLVAFGPEIGRVLGRMRSRRVGDSGVLSIES